MTSRSYPARYGADGVGQAGLSCGRWSHSPLRNYTPNPGYVGSDSFTISAFDGVISGTSTISVNVYNTNPLAWDMDYDTITFGAAAANGTVEMDPNNGSYTYTPNLGFVGTDTINFTVSDGTINSSSNSSTTSSEDLRTEIRKRFPALRISSS